MLATWSARSGICSLPLRQVVFPKGSVPLSSFCKLVLVEPDIECLVPCCPFEHQRLARDDTAPNGPIASDSSDHDLVLGFPAALIDSVAHRMMAAVVESFSDLFQEVCTSLAPYIPQASRCCWL
jgi:hypothetical protein